MFKSWLKYSSCLWVFGLSACGFQLRNNADLPTALQHITVRSTTPYGKVSRELDATLMHDHLTADLATQPVPVITLSAEKFSQSLSLPANTQSSQISSMTLTGTVTLSLSLGQQMIIPNTVIACSRTITVNANQILSEQNQQNMIQTEIARDLVSQIINLLLSHHVATAIAQA